MPDPPHEVPADRVLADLESSSDGLTDEEARRRPEEHGENEILRGGGRSPIDIFVGQTSSSATSCSPIGRTSLGKAIAVVTGTGVETGVGDVVGEPSASAGVDRAPSDVQYD